MSNKNNPQGMNRETNRGWYEDEDPLLGKAKRHHEVAVKKEFEKQGFTGATAIVPSKSKDKEDKNIISICFTFKEKDRDKFDEATEEFMNENDVEVETEAKGDKVTVKLPVENLEDFVEFLGDEGFKLDSEEEEQVQAIIEKDNEKDNAKTAKGDDDNKSGSKDIEADEDSE